MKIQNYLLVIVAFTFKLNILWGQSFEIKNNFYHPHRVIPANSVFTQNSSPSLPIGINLNVNSHNYGAIDVYGAKFYVDGGEVEVGGSCTGLKIDTKAFLGTTYGLNILSSSTNSGGSGDVYGIKILTNQYAWGYNIGIYSEAKFIATGGVGEKVSGKFAGYFVGNVHVNGTLSKTGGTFKIDHPQDPSNKFLSHSFVESPDMMNIYNGNAITNESGEAWIELPSYFESLNKDFRYQLTPIGSLSQVAVIKEIENNRFMIKSSVANLKISWQVTGIRNDAWAKANPIIVEQEKDNSEKGKFLNPEVFQKPREEAIHTLYSNRK